MGEIAGILRNDGGPVDPALVARLARALGGVGKPSLVNAGALVLCHRPLRHDERALALQPLCQPDGAIVAADCRLDVPTDIIAALGIADDRRRDDPALVAAACLRWGPDAAARLNGSFAFAHWDDVKQRLILARDGLGTRPLYYVEHSQYLLFASALQTLLALPEVPRDIDEMSIVQLLTLEQQDNEKTIYRQIRRVPAGGMIVAAKGTFRSSLYWTLDHIAPIKFRRDDDYVMAARELLDRAVACRLPVQGRLGVFLSGGLDSGGLAATAARALGDRGLDVFHRAPGGPFPGQIMDERALVDQLVARYPNITLSVLDGNQQYAADIEPEIDAATYLVPRSRGLNAGWFEPMDDALRKSDVTLMFSGGCGNMTLSWDGRPHFGNDLRTGHWVRAWRGVAAAAERRGQSTGRFLAGTFVRPLLPRALLRRRVARLSGDNSPWAVYSMVSDDYLASIDYSRLVRGTDHEFPMQGGVSRRDRFRALQSQRNRDKQSATRRAGGCETVDPYADRRLVEFTLGIPETQFWHAGEDRWLARRVLADRLPPAIVTERRRGVQCPEWYDVVSQRRDGLAEAVERIGRSPLASRIVDIPRMKALLDSWPRDAEAARSHKQLYGFALARGISVGGFLRWHEGGNE